MVRPPVGISQRIPSPAGRVLPSPSTIRLNLNDATSRCTGRATAERFRNRVTAFRRVGGMVHSDCVTFALRSVISLQMRIRPLVVATGLLVVSAAGGQAQTATGNIYGIVTEPSQARLVGAAVALTGAAIRARSAVTDSIGEFRFLTLDPGNYRVAVAMPGLTTVSRHLIVQAGTNVEVTMVLEIPTVEETITVTAETPVVDRKR